MIARLQENKIRKREVSISTYTIRYDQPQTSFSRAPPPREVYRLSPGQLLCQTLLTRAQGNHLGTLYRKCPAKNVLCENGNKNKTEGPASSTRTQRGRTAASATSSAAAARCSRGRRSAAAGGCCGGAASCGGGLAAQPMSDTRHQHMSPGAAPTSKHLHLIVRQLLRARRTERAEWRVCAALFN